MKKYLSSGFKTAVAVMLLVMSVTACNSHRQETGQGDNENSQEESAQPEDTGEAVVIKIGASPVPHSEILSVVKEELAKENITLEIVEYTDYVQPNMALENGELDANYFQHLPYLEDFNAENGTSLVSAAAVHFEPLGIYPGKTKSLEDLPDGGVIAVPSDTTNEARALLLLQAAGIITLPENSGLSITPRDIVENPKNISFQEVEAALVPSVLQDVDVAVINGNYALGAGINIDEVLTAEDSSSVAAQTFANIVAIKSGDEYRPEIQALVKAITSASVSEYINAEYSGLVIPVF